MDSLKPQELANTVWACAMAGKSDAPLFVALARAAKWLAALLGAAVVIVQPAASSLF